MGKCIRLKPRRISEELEWKMFLFQSSFCWILFVVIERIIFFYDEFFFSSACSAETYRKIIKGLWGLGRIGLEGFLGFWLRILIANHPSTGLQFFIFTRDPFLKRANGSFFFFNCLFHISNFHNFNFSTCDPEGISIIFGDSNPSHTHEILFHKATKTENYADCVTHIAWFLLVGYPSTSIVAQSSNIYETDFLGFCR